MGFECCAYSLEHQIEGGKLSHLMLSDLNRDLLEDSKHGALTDGAVLSLKAVVHRQALDGRLKQGKLVRNKRIAMNEVVTILKVFIGLRAISKIKQCLKVIRLKVINIGQQTNARIVFEQQSLLDNLSHIGAGELHAVCKTRLNFREVIALFGAHFSDDAGHFFLRRHYDPSLPLALRSQAFRNGLQIGHQLGIARNVLTYLIDKEIEPESGCLRINIRFHLIGKILNRQAVVGAKLIQHTDNSLAGYLAISLIYETLDPCRTRSSPLPIILG